MVITKSKTVTINKSSNVTIKGDNNVYVEGNYYEAKNYKPAKQYKHYSNIHHSTGNIHYLQGHNSWCSCGRFHLMRWSNTSSSRVVYFNYGSRYGVSYMYPSYHRKYLFVSIGGHWPSSYRYRRYYRYGCHPGTWYGSRPYQYPSVDNSVTNNYYAADGQPISQQQYESSYDASYDTSYGEVPYDDFSDIRAKLALENLRKQQEAIEDAPAAETLADVYFENAVSAFAGGNYQIAIDAINKAMALAPQDVVLPFTLSQSLFADGQYTQAAEVLREIFNNMPRDQETLYYPRGLYADEKVLEEQILVLSKKVEEEPSNGELSLLLAYHQLGTGDYDNVAKSLYQAQFDSDNSVSVEVMQDLLEDALLNEQAANEQAENVQVEKEQVKNVQGKIEQVKIGHVEIEQVEKSQVEIGPMKNDQEEKGQIKLNK